MESLTKEQAIEEHRKMWNWIADQCIEQQRAVSKIDYFRAKGFDEGLNCFLCRYYDQIMIMPMCKDTGCILKWPRPAGADTCVYANPCVLSYYNNYLNYMYLVRESKDKYYKEISEVARNIANLEINEQFEEKLEEYRKELDEDGCL